MTNSDKATVFLLPVMSIVHAVVNQAEGVFSGTPETVGASVGAGHIPGIGPALHIGIHDRAGKVWIATLPGDAAKQFAACVTARAAELAAGDHDKPQVMQ